MIKLMISIANSSICEYLTKQLDTFFPYENNINEDPLLEIVNSAINNIEICFSKIVSPYYININNSYFNHLNVGHYTTFIENYSKTVPLKRLGKPSEISLTVSFLLSEEASYINGENLIVDGGWTSI